MKRLFLTTAIAALATTLQAQEPNPDASDVYCFAAHTKIMITDATFRNIEEIQEGDIVLSYNPETKETFQTKVLKTAAVPHDNLVCYTLCDGRHITATDDHPMLTPHGWVSDNPIKTATYKGYETISAVTSDDEIITSDGTEQIAAISRPRQKIMTYTIVKLEDGNIFFANGLAVGTEERK